MSDNKITREHIESVIEKKDFHKIKGTTITLCVLTLKNGYTVTGESACVDPENFDDEIGKQVAYQHAFEKIWRLEGYLLQQKLFDDCQDKTAG
ncbi:Gp49 family protein [Thiolapillus sp.]|uniref:Gp49 family protein n=1 Tax=Thiolapillus sp. TaxID=2017437 RepID=UPI003AF8F8F9